jgi:hypothetical protein
MTKDEQIAALKEALSRARRHGAIQALRGVVHIQSLAAHEYEVNGTAAEFRAAERIVAEAQQMLEAISAS